MTIPNPEHLFDQATRLIEQHGKGAPRQVDIRRAVSASYYGVFHFILRESADLMIGAALRGAPLYVLAYRSIDHGKLGALCADVRKRNLPAKLGRYAPAAGFCRPVKDFAELFLELKEKREFADYDPSLKFRTADAALLVATAHTAIARFQAAPADERRTFLTLLVFPAR